MRSRAVPVPVVLAIVALLSPAGAAAQWLNYPTPGIPRLADGKPNLSAPAPRTARRQARPLGYLARRRTHLPLQHRPGSRSGRRTAVGGGAVPAACARRPQGQPAGEVPAGQRPVPQLLQPDARGADAGADRAAIRGAEQPASHRVHRRPRVAHQSQSRVAGLFDWTLGGRHAGHHLGRLQRARLAGQRRPSPDRVAAPHRAAAPPGLRPHGVRDHDRRSEGIHQAVYHQGGTRAGRGYRLAGGLLRERARSAQACRATPASG